MGLPGQRFEDRAAAFLKGLGYKILERNWRCPAGEIDIIASDGGTLVFVEVKGRTTEYIPAMQAVDRKKQQRIANAAAIYLSGRAKATPAARFDIVTVTALPGVPEKVDHLKDAFELRG